MGVVFHLTFPESPAGGGVFFGIKVFYDRGVAPGGEVDDLFVTALAEGASAGRLEVVPVLVAGSWDGEVEVVFHGVSFREDESA